MTDRTRWWRVFGLRRGGGRRRQSRRFTLHARVVARCDSWPEFLELVTGDVSSGGMFVATDQHAEVGEGVELRLELPDGTELPLRGRVAVDGDDGLGIELLPPAPEHAERFERVLARAREAEPRPEPPADSEPPPLFDPPDGAEPMKLSSVHAALGADRIPAIDPDEITGEHALEDIELTVWEPPIEPGAPPSIAPRGRPGPDAGPVIGVDLGHTTTSASISAGDRVRLIALGDGTRSLSSAIRDGDGGSRSPKRELEDGDAAGAAALLGRVREAAERELGRPVGRAVLSVPIHFDDEAIERLRGASEDAGLEVVAVIDEPSAAVTANRFDLDTTASGGLLGVYDVGGGGFDFTVIDASGGDLEVLATAGSRELGGDRLDAILAESAANQLSRARRVDIRQQPREWRALLDACERAKRELSTAEVAALVVDDVFRTADGAVDLRITVSRALFEQAAAHIIERTADMCRETLERLGRTPADLSAIVLSGGVCYIPAVRRRLAAALGVPLRSAVPADYAVCLGAGVHAALLTRRSIS